MPKVATSSQLQSSTKRITSFISDALVVISDAIEELSSVTASTDTATATTAGLMSAADKKKLDSLGQSSVIVPAGTFTPVIEITAYDSDVFVSNGTVTLSAASSTDNIYSFNIPSYGNWTVTSTYNDDTVTTQTILVDSCKIYDVTDNNKKSLFTKADIDVIFDGTYTPSSER